MKAITRKILLRKRACLACAVGISSKLRCIPLLLLALLSVVLALTISASTGFLQGEEESASEVPSGLFEGNIYDKPLDESLQLQATLANNTAQEELPDPAIEKAVSPIIDAYPEQISVVYLPLAGKSTTIPSSENTPLEHEAFTVNSSVRRTSASMIKLLILAELLREVAEGTHALDEQITFDGNDFVGGSGIIQTMESGTILSLHDVAYYMIAESDNTATNKLIDLLGMEAINTQATELGLSQTILQRKMLDNEAVDQGRENYTCAADITTILSLISQGSFIDASMSSLALDFLKQQNDTDGIASGLPSEIQVANKTGTLSRVEHDGAIVLANKPYILVIMTEGIANEEATAVIASVSRAIYEQA